VVQGENPRPARALAEAETEFSPVEADLGSFRDPAGSVIAINGRVFRRVNPSGRANLEAFFNSAVARRYAERGLLVRTEVVPAGDLARLGCTNVFDADPDEVVLEHEPIWFPSFPYEWPPEMLHAAAGLTLDLAAELLEEGRGLKDATPFNVLFRGPEPVFVDVLSWEDRDPLDPVWTPCAQFLRTFLLPLAADKLCGWRLQASLTGRWEGLDPKELYRSLGWLRRLRRPLFGLVTLPIWLEKAVGDQPGLYSKRRVADPAQARFILRALLSRLRRQLGRCAPDAGRRSQWSPYSTSHSHYTSEQWALKEDFVRQTLVALRPKRTLDVGCNTGQFSLMAAEEGARVVAIDNDPIVVGQLWRQARQRKLDVLPLVVDFARPSPAVGWRNRECPSFLDRARGKFDLVLMLAILHHLLVSERIPVLEILDLARELTTDWLLIEYVDPQDPMFQRIARGRDKLHSGLSAERFAEACLTGFRIVRSVRLPGAQRWLFLLRKD